MKTSLSYELRPYDPNEKANRDLAYYLHHGEFPPQEIAMNKDYIIELLKSDLEEAVRLMREHAASVGPMHSWWEYIADFEGHLKTIAGDI